MKKIYYYIIAVLLGIVGGYLQLAIVHQVANVITSLFTNIFKALSLPIIALSITTTFSQFSTINNKRILRSTLGYTFITTLIAASVSAGLYIIFNPENIVTSVEYIDLSHHKFNYLDYLLKIVPSNIIGAFTEQNILGILFISIIIGMATSKLEEESEKKWLINFFNSLYQLFLLISRWIISILPIGLFGFVTNAIIQLHQSNKITNLGGYLGIIILANLFQGIIVLPLMLKIKGINPFPIFKNMIPALTTAFFSKSSTGALAITLNCAEKKLKINPNISRFVLPLCTTINMNGCAAFIFTTVLFVMQSNDIAVTYTTILLWVAIATIAAIGNAAVPMGCFFLSASLLSGMHIPITLMGVILPFYSMIDMVETALNVWSDSCVVVAVNQDIMQENLQKGTKSDNIS